MWVSRSRIDTRSLPYLPNSGMNFATGSTSLMRPSSTSIITAVEVATTLVSEARSKIVSAVIASRVGTSARSPQALRNTMRSPWPTSTTAPGVSRAAIASWMTASSLARRAESNDEILAGVVFCWRLKPRASEASVRLTGRCQTLMTPDYSGAVLPREPIDDIYQFGQLFTPFRIAFGDALRHAVVHVVLEDGEADPVQGSLGGRQLLKNLDAQPGLLHHASNAADLALDPVETRN